MFEVKFNRDTLYESEKDRAPSASIEPLQNTFLKSVPLAERKDCPLVRHRTPSPTACGIPAQHVLRLN